MWDDPDLSYIPELVSHVYFGLSDEEIERERVIIRESLIPDAEQPAEYYHTNNMALDGSNDKKIIEHLITDCVSGRCGWFEISGVKSFSALEKAVSEKINASDMLSGWRIYMLSELYGVCAVQLYYE